MSKVGFGLNRITETTLADIRRSEQIQDFGYNSLSGSRVDNINPINQNVMITDNYYMWLKNPLANTMIELMLDFTLGDGITYEAEDKKTKEVLDKYWEDSDNNWDIMSDPRIRDLFLYGESILSKDDSKFTNSVKTISIYPGTVREIFKDKNNTELIESMTFLNDDTKKKVIRMNNKTGLLEGDIFYFKINSTTHQTRGLSDLFVSRDWLRLYDKSLYATMERIGLLLSFVYDVTIKGANESQLRAKLKSIQKAPPQPGGVRVHNETEVWQNVQPRLSGKDFEDTFRLFKSQPIAGSRMPEHFFGMGGDVNYATALSMNTPFYRKVKKRQKYIKYMFTTLFNYVIQQAQTTGIISKGADTEFKIIIPEPDKEIAVKIADTLFKFANALVTLESNSMIDRKSAVSVLNMIIGQLGVEINEDDLDGQGGGMLDKVAKMVKDQNDKNGVSDITKKPEEKEPVLIEKK